MGKNISEKTARRPVRLRKAGLCLLVALGLALSPLGAGTAFAADPPHLYTPQVTSDGNILLEFDRAMQAPSSAAGFSISIIPDYTTRTVTAAVLRAGDATKIDLTLSTPIHGGEGVLFAYDSPPGTLQSAEGVPLASFPYTEITNWLPHPTLGSAAPPDGTVGAAYSHTFTATGGTPSYSFYLDYGSLPGGLTLDGHNGALSGVPTAAGSFAFRIKVADTKSARDIREFTITIDSPPNVLEIVRRGAPAGQYATMGAALAAAQTGDTLRLLQDIDYNSAVSIAGKDITFDLDGHTLTIATASGNALEVGSGGRVRLDTSAGGALNVEANGAGTRGLYVHHGGIAEVSGVTVTGDSDGVIALGGAVTVAGGVSTNGQACRAVYAYSGTIEVTGSVSAQGAGSTGAYAVNGGSIAVGGALSGATYIRVGTQIKSQADMEPASAKPGYAAYTDGASTVWVKAPDCTVTFTSGGAVCAARTIPAFTSVGSAVPGISASHGATVAAPANPLRSCYNFGGWYRDAACTVPWNFASDTVTGDITLYAKWTAQTPGALLSRIALSAGSLSPAFKSAKTSYTVSLREADAGVTVTPVKAYDGAAMTIDGKKVASKTVKLANGKSATMKVKVTWNKKTTTYTLTIKRPKSTNNRLASLKASAGKLSPAFNPSVTSYTLTLPADTSKVTITAAKASSLAAATPAKKTYTLRNGQSIQTAVKVKSQSGATRTYTIRITRAKSANANLASLTVSARGAPLAPKFKAGTATYTVTLPAGTSSATLSWKAADRLAKVTVGGKARTSLKVALKNGQSTTVTIAVKAQAGNTRQYVIVVSRE